MSKVKEALSPGDYLAPKSPELMSSVDALLIQQIRYEPSTGKFLWTSLKPQNKKNGAEVGSLWWNKKGKQYWVITHQRRRLHAHCVAVFLMEGRWPTGEVDHRDGDGLNNKWDNLREGTKSQNQGNSRKRKDNTAGFKGVGFHKATKKFVARIQCNGQRHHLGLYASPEEAHAAYASASQEMFGEFSRSN